MKYFKRSLSWLKELLIWFYNGYLFWIYFSMVVVFLFFSSLYMYFGIGLQLLGIITIVIGINNKIKLFAKENSIKYILKYFARFPSFKPKNIVLNISDSLHLQISTNADISRGAKKPDQTFTDIIRYIDEEILYLNQHISNIRTEFYDQIKVLTKQITDQKEQLDSNLNNVEKKLELSNTSDIRLELFGAGCIAAGLIFTILPLL